MAGRSSGYRSGAQKALSNPSSLPQKEITLGGKDLGQQLITVRGSGGEGEGRSFSGWRRPGELTLPVGQNWAEGLGNGFRQIWGPIDWPLFLQRSWSGGRELWILLTLAALGASLSPQRPRRRPPSLMGF